jgi:YesN/AraC family two-component response regulator
MRIHIKNMVSNRCKMIVKSELESLDIDYKSIDFVEIETNEDVPQSKLKKLEKNLRQNGLEIIESRKEIIAEKIKTAIIELVQYSNEQLKNNLSYYLSNKLNYNYTYLANIFSEVKGTSIEKFYIKRKIERVKELLIFNELNLKEISIITQYSSIGHLSNQFKKTTGLAPSRYKQMVFKTRMPLEQIAV